MVLTFNGKDCKVTIGGTIVAVATGVDVNTSKDVKSIYGLNHSTPQLLKEGNIGYDFSIESLYTTTTYGGEDMLDLINTGKEFDIVFTIMNESDVAQTTVTLSDCRATTDNVSVSDDGDLTCSLSGQGKSRALT